MYFEESLGVEIFSASAHSRFTRQAVRAIICQEEHILMVRSESGDYKLPGGGIEGTENHEQALQREVEEETGFPECSVWQKIGTITERYPDAFVPDAYFEMVSHYYLCKLGVVSQGPLRLSQQELEQGFEPVWIRPAKAIVRNREILRCHGANRWIHRENFVLARLQEASKN